MINGDIRIPDAKQFDQLLALVAKMADAGMQVDYGNSPGGKYLLAGDTDAGFLGFVQAAHMGDLVDNGDANKAFSGANLALVIGLSGGSLINSNTVWIKYIWKGKICFTPLKPLRHSVTWDVIYNTGAVYGVSGEGTLPPTGRLGTGLSIDATDNSINTTTQNFLSGTDSSDTVAKVGDTLVLKGWTNADNNGEVTVDHITNTKITVSGKTLVTESGGKTSRLYEKTKAVAQNRQVKVGASNYKVRLFRGAEKDPTDSYANADRGGIGKNNEWNWIMGQLHERAKLKNWAYPAYMDTDLGDFGVHLTDEDMLTHHLFGAGNYTWCQDVNDVTSWRRVNRGIYGVSNLTSGHSWRVSSHNGWRPVLEWTS